MTLVDFDCVFGSLHKELPQDCLQEIAVQRHSGQAVLPTPKLLDNRCGFVELAGDGKRILSMDRIKTLPQASELVKLAMGAVISWDFTIDESKIQLHHRGIKNIRGTGGGMVCRRSGPKRRDKGRFPIS